MRRVIAVVYVCAIVAGSWSLFAQQPSALDQIQNMEIASAQDTAASNQKRIDSLEMSVYELKSAVREAKAWVIGFGAGISGLQILQMFSSKRNYSYQQSAPRLKDKY